MKLLQDTKMEKTRLLSQYSLLKKGFSDIVFGPMAQDNLVKLVNKETGETYWSTKNRKKLAGIKLEFKKYSRKLRKVVSFKESKK